MENPPLLQVRDLTVRLQIGETTAKVVDGVSFDLEKGKTLALVGESGCGKSMTALALMRILPRPPALPPEGQVLLHGQNLLAMPEKKLRRLRGSKIAMIFQDPNSCLNPVYTVGDQLLEVADLHLGLRGKKAVARAVQALDEVGVPESTRRLCEYPHQLSGGLKQRVMIAMALMCEPDLLIADEPTTALDVTVQAQVLALMKRLQETHGTAILLITHDMGVVRQMADDVIVMYASWAVEKGSCTTIFEKKSHPYTQGLLASRPDPNVERGKLHTIQGQVPPPTHWPSGCHFHPRCPFVMPQCKQGPVPNVEISKAHQALCWLHAQDS